MASGHSRRVWQHLRRKLVFDHNEAESTNLRRCLGRWDLISLGLGSTLGVGVYVLIGDVALKFSGPSIILSFLIASVASMFAGLCFAEFGARVPRAGSAYVYTYVTIGECVAFFVGWNVILEGIFGTASVAKGLSVYVDSMLDNKMSAWFLKVVPIPSNLFSSYFDLFAFGVIVVLGVLLAVGARESAFVNNIFSMLNMAVILFVLVAGLFHVNPSNWSIPASAVPEGYGVGGFFPYGAWGTLQGATLCFYGFTGFDAISSTGEEVKNPRRIIPQAIVAVLAIVFLVFVCVSAVITLMVPYYLLDKVTATALAFEYVGWSWARWLVSVGAVAGIFASLFGSLLPVTRLLYAMASDGLILHWFSYINSKTKTPIFATSVSTSLVAILAATLELEELILMMAVGTLCSYTAVATCVIILRYKSKAPKPAKYNYFKQILGCGEKETSLVTMRIAQYALFLYLLICILAAVIAFHIEPVNTYIYIVVLNAVALVLIIIIALQPKAKEDLSFKTPLVPLVPCLSIYMNIHLMFLVKLKTWLRVLVWIAIGVPVYLISLWCYKKAFSSGSDDIIKKTDHTNENGRPPVHIIVESPTPPSTLEKKNIVEDDQDYRLEHLQKDNKQEKQEKIVENPFTVFKVEDIIVQQAIIENNEEKEAKIIDLLDQVLQAEEDSYGERLSLQEANPEQEIMTPIENTESIPHRKSLTELSDAGSEISFSNQDTKYNVIAQVHREDLPKVNEEEEKIDTEAVNDTTNENINDQEYEQITLFNDSETNSRTDESGYSDTIDRNNLNDSMEDTREAGPRIPTPPPMDEKYFNSPYLLKKSYTIPARPKKLIEDREDEERKPRESVQSNTSHGTDDGNITFGSSRQKKFMNKLNNIFQTKMASDNSGDEQRKRSNSAGDIRDTDEGDDLTPKLMRDRPSFFLDLKKELQAMSVPNLRPIRNEDGKNLNKTDPIIINDDDETTEDSSLSREDLKSKLENIFASGGPKLVKSRRMKSNPPTPEEASQEETSSAESIPKLPKVEKNDTLKRQKDKFGEVLNSFRLSLKEDAV